MQNKFDNPCRESVLKLKAGVSPGRDYRLQSRSTPGLSTRQSEPGPANSEHQE
jgi:hypothetical protein